MNSRPLWIAVLLLLAGIAVLVFAYPETMLSPGGLSKSHMDLASDCFACHTPFRGSTAQQCTACHEVSRIGRFTSTGQALPPTRVPFHQQLREQDCLACHLEHQGGNAAASHPKFSHDLLSSQLRPQCTACHVKPQDPLHERLQNNCQQCHSTQAWTPAHFEHSRYFLLDHDHDVACATCHVERDFKRYSCYGCHEHTPARIRAEHLEEGIRDFDNCVECHRGPWEPKEGKGERRD